ncbi:hypothetical protein ACFOTA_16355 [Chitinophaga sp. GCM10012297]|uniref:Uncharacterized protein n=1 Tax=Chitinophaga chungangae TaxID=2821488 RepID=A0ABS3YGI1_9BACT|nr:hypothetical protein [Chitinophaga chungangae]MBO9153793.1 hypothetical protein [Chitinophaga chungangae]
MEVTEKKKQGVDSVFFEITNPVEQAYGKYNPAGGDLIYTLLVQPVSNSLDYFKENNLPFTGRRIRFYNPSKVDVFSFLITIVPKRSIPVKNIAVRELYTMEYHVKNKGSNYFEINMPQLNYGYISYKRLKEDSAKITAPDTIVWDGVTFVREN